jgi:hypothetical protein
MHNCKATTDRIAELLLNRPNARPDDLLSKELLRCAECRNEFDAVKETLRITTRVIEKSEPSKSYWNGYYTRLKQQLDNATIHDFESRETTWILSFFKSSIRLPVPVGLALLVLFAVGIRWANRDSQKQVVITQTISVPVPFEVPVVQEKIVTRVLYRDRVRNRNENSTANSVVAKTQNEARPTALIGFKPLDEVKLTVIKGGSPDEK